MTPEGWQRIKEIFQAAVDEPAGDRESFVASRTGDDRAMFDEIMRMLRYAAGSGVLDRPAWSGLPLADELEPGARLGPYEILQQIGAGGMGTVYRARDSRLDRIVAIKILNQEFRHRLPMEARAISALNHPHVCALYDIGDQEGQSYLVMEYVEGQTLAERLLAGALPCQ